jgi:transcriptional regulator with XRE-family HTH domain
MKLAEYMKLTRKNDDDLAREIGRSRVAVCRYRSGKIIPPITVIASIEAATSGAVTWRDFLPSTQTPRVGG